MRLPSKITSYSESVISKFPPVLTALHMQRGIQGEPGAVVAQHAGQGLHIHAAGEGHRGKSMAQIMEANALLNAAFASSFRLILDTASGLQ